MEEKKKFLQINTLQRALAMLLAVLIVFTGGMAVPADAFGLGAEGTSGIALAAAAESGSGVIRTETVTETKTITDVASYDVWKHINGTWQYGKKPGSSVSASFTIYIAGRLPAGATVTSVEGSFNYAYSGSYSAYAVPSGNVNVKSFTNKNLTYSVSTSLDGSPMDLRNDSQSEYTEGYRYYIPSSFEVTYTVEREIGEATPDADGSGDSGEGSDDKEKPKEEYIEPIRTPSIMEMLGGAQKENRRQVLTILVAEDPSHPLTELWVELEEAGGGNRVHLTHDVSKAGGSGAAGNTNDNSTLIKTRPISDTGSDNKFTRVELEFLTKNDEQIEMTYRIYARDSLGKSDTVEANFTVRPDEAPAVEIAADNPQFRDEGSNTAYVYAEDVTAYDGDDAERTWYVREELASGKVDGESNSGESEGEPDDASGGAIAEQTEWSEWVKAEESSGLLMDASFGTWRGVAYKKTGVGKVEFKLDVKDKWIEGTLEEYVSESDILTGSGEVQTEVDNIAPVVSLSAEKMKKGNLLLLARSAAEKLSFKDAENKLSQTLIESGISTDIHTARVKTADELNSADTPDAVSILNRSYGYGVEGTFLEKGWYMVDSNTLYTVDASWSQNTSYTNIYYYNIDAPYTIKAYRFEDTEAADGASGESGVVDASAERFKNISEDTIPTWQITIPAEQIDNVGAGSIIGMAQDDTDEYLYFVTSAKTLIYDKDTGVFVGSIPFVLGNDNFVAGSKIYTLKSDGLYSINMRTGKISNVYAGDIVMKSSYSDPEGSAKRINNEINFAEGSGSRVMRAQFNPNTEEVRLTEINPTGATYASTYNIGGFGLDGKLCLLRDGKSAYHIIDRNGVEIAYKNGWSTAREHDVLPVYKTDGTFDYIVVLVNGYDKTGTSSSGYKYKYSINETVYDIYENTEPLTYSYTRTTGSSGTDGSGTDAGKAMYAVQFGRYIVVCTGNWSTCISDGSSLGMYYETSFVQMVFDMEARSVNRYGSGSTQFSALNTGGYYCEYGKINDNYVVSAYSNVGARNAYGEGTNWQMLTVARLPRTEDIEAAMAVNKFAPVKGSAGLDSAAVVYEGSESELVSERVSLAENALISDTDLEKITDGMSETAGEIGGLKVITDGSGGASISTISKTYKLNPNTEYFYEIEYIGDSVKPVCFTAALERAAGAIETSGASVDITGNSYVVTEIQDEDFSSFINTNKYFEGAAEGRMADGVYYGAALHRSKDSGSKNRAVSDSSTLKFTIENGRKAILMFDYQMAADRGNIDEAYVDIDGSRWYRNITVSDAVGTYMHPHILEAGVHEIGFGVKGYGRRPISTYMTIDNLKVIYIEEADSSLGSVAGMDAETAIVGGVATKLSYGNSTVKGSFRTPNEIASYAGQEIRYINQTPDAGAIDIATRTDTDNTRGLSIAIPEDKKAVFTAISLLSSPVENRAVRWTVFGKQVNVRWESSTNYYPSTVPSPLKITKENLTGTVGASTDSLYKVGAGFANLEMVLTNVLNGSIEAKKYFISPETSELFFEDEVFNGRVDVEISGSGEWAIKDFKLYYIDEGKRVYVEDGYMNSEDAKSFRVEGGTFAVERLNGEVKELPVVPVYKKGEMVDYKTTYFDYENDPSKAQHWRYTHVEANDGPHPDAGKILDAPIETFDVDGKYIVEHWQEDSTGRLAYDKTSNIAELTFYIEGAANTPWVESIKTNPSKPAVGDNLSLSIRVNDVEKDPLSLTTEVYYKDKLVYTHTQNEIIADAAGRYPAVNTGSVTGSAKEGKYFVVCTVRDELGAGIGTYEFEVELNMKITGSVSHFAAWEQKRLDYNAANPSHPRSSNTYWASEAFDLKAEVVGKPSAVTVATAEFPEKTLTLTKTLGTDTGTQAVYAGSFFDSKIAAALAKEGRGDLTFIFTAVYSGGIKVTDKVTVIIDDTDGSSMKIHRVW